MGLAATQARLLSLTQRQHAVEYAAQRVEAQKLQLANETDRVYSDYLESLDASKVQYKLVEDDGSFVFMDASFANLAEAGFLFNVEGVVCTSYDEVVNILKEKGIVELTASDSYSVLSTLVSEGLVMIMQPQADPESGFTYDYREGKIIYMEEDIYDENSNPEGIGFVKELNDEQGDNKPVFAYTVFENTNLSSSTKIQEVSDEINLKKAEAIYEADMRRISAKDKRYDTELSQLEAERNAIKTEIETLGKVATDNVDRTFKLFV